MTRAVELGMRDEFGLGPAGINVPLARVNVPAVAHVCCRSAARAAPAWRTAPRRLHRRGRNGAAGARCDRRAVGLTAAENASPPSRRLNRTDIAAAAGVSDGSTKTQLAAIFDKTGAHDQRELELLIRELAGGCGKWRARQRQA